VSGLLQDDDELSLAIWDRREREKGKEGHGRCDVAGRETEGGSAGTTVERLDSVTTIWGRDADDGGGVVVFDFWPFDNRLFVQVAVGTSRFRSTSLTREMELPGGTAWNARSVVVFQTLPHDGDNPS
jgi:hypothetical protein